MIEKLKPVLSGLEFSCSTLHSEFGELYCRLWVESLDDF